MRPTTLSAVLSALVLSAALTGCSERPASEDVPQLSESERAVVAAHMKDHFYRTGEMQRAVIAGRLADVQAPAEWMSEHAASRAMPEEWEVHLEPMREAARRVARAPDLRGAASATAAMATACGSCHRTLDAGVGFAVEAPPPTGENAPTHMQRHAWASGRMWEGLIASSEIVWKGGAEVLREAPLVPAEFTVPLDRLADVTAMEKRVHEIGERALAATEWNARAAAYGEFLATCAGCHEATAAGPM